MMKLHKQVLVRMIIINDSIVDLNLEVVSNNSHSIADPMKIENRLIDRVLILVNLKPKATNNRITWIIDLVDCNRNDILGKDWTLFLFKENIEHYFLLILRNEIKDLKLSQRETKGIDSVNKNYLSVVKLVLMGFVKVVSFLIVVINQVI